MGYSKSNISTNIFVLTKNEGETPLECINRAKENQILSAKKKYTYAGRLDPMASGLLLVLADDLVYKKDEYLKLDKEYEVNILFGVSTDTGDILGEIQTVKNNFNLNKNILLEAIKKCIGEFEEDYPKYSSKTVGGKPIFLLTRLGKVFKLPKHNVKILSIEVMDYSSVSGVELASLCISRIKSLKGDFRQKSIISKWKDFAKMNEDKVFYTVKIKVNCASGAYMRVLAEKVGHILGTPALAYSIKRTKVGEYGLQ